MSSHSQDGEVETFLDSIKNDSRRADSVWLTTFIADVTGDTAQLWGSMVGFGTYQFRYASGREGDYFKVGFAPRKADLVLYLMSGLVGYDDLLEELGPHKAGKSAIYVKRIDDLDDDVLTKLIQRCVDHIDQVEADLGAIPRMSEMPPFRSGT